jgi:hypothetical protein
MAAVTNETSVRWRRRGGRQEKHYNCRSPAARVTARHAARNSGDNFGQADIISRSSASFCARSCASADFSISEAAAAMQAWKKASTGSIPARAAILTNGLGCFGIFGVICLFLFCPLFEVLHPRSCAEQDTPVSTYMPREARCASTKSSKSAFSWPVCARACAIAPTRRFGFCGTAAGVRR